METQETIRQMEMNPGTKKFYFTEMKVGSKNKILLKSNKASVYTKMGIWIIGLPAVRTLGIANQFYKVFFDAPNKTLGIRVVTKLPYEEQKNGWRLIKTKEKSGMNISVKPALQQMYGLKEKYLKLEIKRYKDYQSKMDDNTYYYVELK